MSNLGWYQVMTTLAKKVGGPKQLAVCVAASGYAIGKVGEIAIKAVASNIKSHIESKHTEGLYTVKEFGVTNEGISVYPGEQIKVLVIDEDSILIEIIGKADNPYFVSEEFLGEITDYNR